MSAFPPRISIVVPSFNQGQFIGETLQSLVDQNYPNLEVVIQDGGSTDGAATIAARYAQEHPDVFRLFVEKDRGQADALNRGFRRTTGTIMGFLNSDDTLLPGCLARVAKEIVPEEGRLVVVGRCLFTGEGSPYVGLEHPARYAGHFDLLAIWKRGFNTIPQPSTFWHRRVWDRAGGLDENEHHALDYDLFCRFSRHFAFHVVDEIWSTYRMHPVSKSASKSEVEVLELSTSVSRKHWGPWWKPLRWKCAFSHWKHDRRRHEHARHHARRAEDAWKAGRGFRGWFATTRTMLVSPTTAWHRLIVPRLQRSGLERMRRVLFLASAPRSEQFTGRYADGWIGPIYREQIDVPSQATHVVAILEHIPQGEAIHAKVSPVLKANDVELASQVVEQARQFFFKVEIDPFRGKTCTFSIETPEYFVPSSIYNNGDQRKLSIKLHSLHLEP
jgi:glycosyltransferase involved in cell wall biosynthesis